MLAVVVREAVGQIAAPEMTERIERAALLRAGHEELPGDPHALIEFVQGPLYATIMDYLGEDVAEAVKMDLHPILMSAQVAPRTPPPPETEDAAAAVNTEPPDDEPGSADDFSTLEFELEGVDLELEDNAPEVEAKPPNVTGIQPKATPGEPALDGIELDFGAEPLATEAEEPATKDRGGVKSRVLVADDDASVLQATARSLRGEGFEVITAGDGYAALELCQSMTPAVVVADLHMPAISGRQLIQTLERTMGRDAPPVIIVTGNVFAPNNIQGAAEVMRKPIQIDELTTAIELAVWDHAAGI